MSVVSIHCAGSEPQGRFALDSTPSLNGDVVLTAKTGPLKTKFILPTSLPEIVVLPYQGVCLSFNDYDGCRSSVPLSQDRATATRTLTTALATITQLRLLRSEPEPKPVEAPRILRSVGHYGRAHK